MVQKCALSIKLLSKHIAKEVPTKKCDLTIWHEQ